jgi:hypothetical protein
MPALLTKNIDEPMLKPKGIEVLQDQAGDAPRRAKMVAERRLPRGTGRHPGPVGRQHVRDERGRRGGDARLREDPERQEPAADDEVPLRHRAHLFRQCRDLQSQADQPGPDGLQGLARSEARQQDRLHRYPVPGHHDRASMAATGGKT